MVRIRKDKGSGAKLGGGGGRLIVMLVSAAMIGSLVTIQLRQQNKLSTMSSMLRASSLVVGSSAAAADSSGQASEDENNDGNNGASKQETKVLPTNDEQSDSDNRVATSQDTMSSSASSLEPLKEEDQDQPPIEVDTTATAAEATTTTSVSSNTKETEEKSKRMDFYKERYGYQSPIARWSSERTTKGKVHCGEPWDFKAFFGLSFEERSRLNEDLRIYEFLFKRDYVEGTTTKDRKPVYMEMGGFDGKRESNTRFFDECLGWDGLLVEPNPVMTERLTKNRPHAHRMFYAPSCNQTQQDANTTIIFHSIPFTSATQEGIDPKDDENGRKIKHVPCGTLTEVLLDLFSPPEAAVVAEAEPAPLPTIDFFSLDVEGAEPLILSNLDLNAVRINAMIAESQNRLCHRVCPSRDRVRRIMREQYGYYLYQNVISHSDLFLHPAFYETLPDKKLGGRLPELPPAAANTVPQATPQTTAIAETETDPAKSKRMKRYEEVYGYRRPVPRSQQTEIVDCGEPSEYESFFGLSFEDRSRLDEDRRIYQHFFKDGGSTAERKRQPVYMEMGAFDGKRESNTRFFDYCLGWDGLLVEPNPVMTERLTKNRPHAHKMFYAPSCNQEQQDANTKIQFHSIPFTSATQGGIEPGDENRKMRDVPCGTLTEVLVDLFAPSAQQQGGDTDLPTIDFFSLDVEGAEPHILSNLDLNAVRINVLIAESENRNCGADCPSRERVRQIMRQQYGYYMYTAVISHSDLFLHPAFYETLSNKKLDGRLPELPQPAAPQETIPQATPQTRAIATQPETETDPEKAKRMTHYKEVYGYEQPVPRSKPGAKVDCGEQWDFANFFALSGEDRSRLNEDRQIYKHFFKKDYVGAIERKRQPVYMEMGAFDGRRESNTRFFDYCLGWDGLLVEPNPVMTQRLIKNRPHAHKMFYAPSCNQEQQDANTKIQFHSIPFTSATQGGIEPGDEKRKMRDVPCGTLTQVLVDLFSPSTGGDTDLPTIDFFSLDVEGAEPHILSNLDLNAVRINVVIVESKNRNCGANCPSRDRVREIMRQQYGYYMYKRVISHSDLYLHPAFYEALPDKKIDGNLPSLIPAQEQQLRG